MKNCLFFLAMVLGLTFSLKCAYPARLGITRGSTRRMMGGGGFGAPKKAKFAYSGTTVAGTVGAKLSVPAAIQRPDYASDGVPKLGANKGNLWEVKPKAPEDIPRMRVSGKIAREVIDTAIRMVQPGITTASIDACVHEETIKRDSYVNM